MKATVTDLSGKSKGYADISGVFFFNADTFGDPLAHYEKAADGEYDEILFVNVNAVTSVAVDAPND